MSAPVDPAMKAPPPAAPRKPYRSPRLERLGTLNDITATSGAGGRNDHGTKPLNKTR